MINNEVTAHSTKLFSSRFCLITNSEFRYYKSKEQFLRLQKPLFVVPFFRFTEAKLIKSKPFVKKNDLLFLRISDSINYVNTSSSHRLESNL